MLSGHVSRTFAPPAGLRLGLLSILLLLAAAALRADAISSALSSSLQNAASARLDATYAVILYSDGKRALVPLSSLNEADRAWLEKFAAEHPLGHGTSKVTVVAEEHPIKKTIEKSVTENGVETVQLCPPAVLRDQLGNTCQLYAMIHCMDIAGYYVTIADVYKIVNMVDASSPKNPWADARYAPALFQFPRIYAPGNAFHLPDPGKDPFEWARSELRKGHPILAGFPESIWMELPPAFIAAHGWDGGKEGHAIVVNGFTWNRVTGVGSFHIINSWRDLSEFDLSVEQATGLLLMQWSLSAKNEETPPPNTAVVTNIVLLKAAPDMSLYEVETNFGRRRVAAQSEAEAKKLVESPLRN
jgi:hypothetical protein